MHKWLVVTYADSSGILSSSRSGTAATNLNEVWNRAANGIPIKLVMRPDGKADNLITTTNCDRFCFQVSGFKEELYHI